MRINRKFKGGGAKDNKGYLKTNAENFTPYKQIDGGDITMEGVDIPLIAIPMDNGNPKGMKLMAPGNNYDFEGADSVMEIPIYKKGDRPNWIKEEIKRLEKLGHDRNTAIKMANSKFEEGMYGGDMDFMQDAGTIGMAGAEGSRARFNLVSFPTQYGSFGENFSNEQDGNFAAFENQYFEDVQNPQVTLPTEPTTAQPTESNPQLGPQPLPYEMSPSARLDQIDTDFRAFDPQYVPENAESIGNQPTTTTITGAQNLNLRPKLEKLNLDTQGAVNTEQELVGALAPRQSTVTPEQEKAAIRKIQMDQAEDFQFMNPYEGVDIPTAVNLLGQNIGKGGNKATALGAGLKVAAGLARNFASGMGQAKSNEFALKEYREKQREALLNKAPTQYSQEGGQVNASNLTTQDKSNISDAYGLEITDDRIFDMFEMVQPTKMQKPDIYEPNLGKYKDMNYFDKAQVDGNKIQLATGEKYPGNIDTLDQYRRYLQKENPGYELDIQYKEGGGKVTPETMSTGNFSSETPGMHNVEVEKNEYLLDPEGNLTKVLGESHEKGGVKMELPVGTKIISDHLTLGKKAKELGKEYDINLSSKDTYAKAVDKFYNKYGLQDLINEEAELAKTIKEQQKAIANEGETATRNVNLEFLSSKIKELDEAKKPMMEAAKIFFTKAFEVQEDSKPKAELGGDNQYENGGTSDTDPDPNDVVNEARFKDFFNSLRGAGYEGTDDISEMQEWIVANKPKTVLDYFKKSPATYTSKGLQDIQKENPDVFKEAGVEFKTNSGDYTEEERTKIKAVYQAKGLETDEFLLNQFVDGLEAYRSPLLPFEQAVQPGIMGEYKLTPELLEKLPDNLKDKISKGLPFTTQEEGMVTDLMNNKKGNTGVKLMPDQELLPPMGMIPSTRIERNYGRMEAELFTPDAQLNELNRSVDAAMGQLAQLPSGQQEAAILKLQANKQQQADRILSEVESKNKQLQQQEQSFNIRQADREVDANAIDTLSFEQRSLGAMANTEDDFRRYFNEGQRRNLENYKTIESLNLMNQMNENFDFTNRGVENTVGTGMTNEDLVNMIRMQQALKTGDISTEDNKKEMGGRLGSARRGRRMQTAEISEPKKVARLYRRKNKR